MKLLAILFDPQNPERGIQQGKRNIKGYISLWANFDNPSHDHLCTEEYMKMKEQNVMQSPLPLFYTEIHSYFEVKVVNHQKRRFKNKA